jgi:hypothetical protein
LARILRAYQLVVRQPELVRPVARLTTRPAQEIFVDVVKRT